MRNIAETYVTKVDSNASLLKSNPEHYGPYLEEGESYQTPRTTAENVEKTCKEMGVCTMMGRPAKPAGWSNAALGSSGASRRASPSKPAQRAFLSACSARPLASLREVAFLHLFLHCFRDYWVIYSFYSLVSPHLEVGTFTQIFLFIQPNAP